ncbi:hypothetical protein [Rickettsiella endosymbiont of Dermanyssus gallinae]|nr:hypothetical protein [Rickettsiella endosymbiont of Dermanyssus gallinae]
MSTNDNALTGDEREAIATIYTYLRTVRISKPQIDAILGKFPPIEII